MNITGKQFIGHMRRSAENSETFIAINPATGERMTHFFHNATPEEIDDAVQLAVYAFAVYRKTTNHARASFLDHIADELLRDDKLIGICMEETGLPEARLMGERMRTVNQLKLFAGVLREGSYAEARIDTALPDRKPLPRPDIRQVHVPLGPVAVFGASNFPLAFSVAGGDTTSALAAGCPVIFKAHPLHPATSEHVAQAIINAAVTTDMPDGVFSMVHGNTTQAGMSLVENPGIRAVAFTGSFAGGTALFKAATGRSEPIPVYAEMGSTNPVFILPAAARKRGEAIARGLVGSFTLGAGQFCTNPGMFLGIRDEAFASLVAVAATEVGAIAAAPMLSGSMEERYRKGIAHLIATGKVKELAHGVDLSRPGYGIPALLQGRLKDAVDHASLQEEVFGPCSIALTSDTAEEMLDFARNLRGHLTATIHAEPEDSPLVAALADVLQHKTGRIVYNGFPTGVEVCHAMVHGGPYPSTTDSRSTSVGTGSIKRFLRPVAFQDFPATLLPPELQNENPLNIWRLLNGEFTREPVHR
jgi:2,5-dioxopentanoate dehydrogenase